MLTPWTQTHQPILAGLRRVGEASTASVRLAHEDSWTLYAISRVAELLIAPFQPPSLDPDDDDGNGLPTAAYQQFVTAAGGTFPRARQFHPFLHEIVTVEAADDPHEPPSLTGLCWPGCMVGSLLLLRAGVTVRAGSAHLDRAAAAESTLYWAWWRRYRPVADLSHGWGSNSQWRTRFRRDYWLASGLAYNVDAALEPDPRRPAGVPRDTDVELLRHRCSTLTDHGGDEWVWDYTGTEPAPRLTTGGRLRGSAG